MSPVALFSILIAASILLPSTAAQAQLYRSVGPDGTVTYSDVPPPAAAPQPATPRPTATEGSAATALPYELAQAAQRYPVTLYTSAPCAPCESARNFLRQRGIPFVEKTISTPADAEALQQLAATQNVPVLSIGDQRLDGFSQSAWTQYLDAAGYPKTSRLPTNWQAPAPTALAPTERIETTAPAAAGNSDQAADASPSTTEAPPPSVTPRRTMSNPAGIRF